jgi:type IX secretion system PorP/SprF family membrane protein
MKNKQPPIIVKIVYLLSNNFIYLYFIFSFGIISKISYAQDIHFSQYNLTPLLLNPANTGAYDRFEAILNYKEQWSKISSSSGLYRTMMAACDGRIFQKKQKTNCLSIGLSVYNDRASNGELNTNEINAYLSYHTKLSRTSTLGGGVFGGIAQKTILYEKFSWDEQYMNGSYNSSNSTGEKIYEDNQSVIYPGFGCGVLYKFEKGDKYSSLNNFLGMNLGLSVSRINRPNYSFLSNERSNGKIVSHADFFIGIRNTKISLNPGLVYMAQNGAQEVFAGCFFRYRIFDESKFTGLRKNNSIVLGTHVRSKDAFVASVQLEISEYTFGVSYDMNISGLKTVTYGRGGFEFSIRYRNIGYLLNKSAASF